MLKRIIASLLLLNILLPLLALPFFAARSKVDKSSITDETNISVYYDLSEREDGQILKDNIMLSRYINYERLADGYDRKAHVTVSLPDGFFDYLAGYDLRFESYSYYCYKPLQAYEHGDWINERKANRENEVKYSIMFSVEEADFESFGYDETFDSVFEEEVEYYSNIEPYYDKNLADDPITVSNGKNIKSVIYHDTGTMWDGDEYSKGNFVPYSGYDTGYERYYDIQYDTWDYAYFMTFDELPGVYLKIVFRQYITKRVMIQDKSYKECHMTAEKEAYYRETEYTNADWRDGYKSYNYFFQNPGKVYTVGDYSGFVKIAEDRIKGAKALKMGERFGNPSKLVRITWEDPVYSGSAQGENKSGNKDSVNVIQNAKDRSGSDEGVSVPVAIIIGLTGAGAAAAGAAAALTPNGDTPDDPKKKSYRMYVHKDFGDTVKRGGKPLTVRVNIAEIDEHGTERIRSDLNEGISASGDGMSVNSASLSDRFFEASVSVPRDHSGKTASVTFTFTGEGGSFSNTVVFKVADGPSFSFAENGDAPDSLILRGNSHEIEAIPGDGFTYSTEFIISDCVTEPGIEDISVADSGSYDVRFETTDRHAVYRMSVTNRTAPVTAHDLFAEVRVDSFTVNVRVDDEQEPLHGYVSVKLYPEGLTVRSRDLVKKGDLQYVRIQSYEKDHVGGLDSKWQVSEIFFTLAVKGTDRALICPREASYRFDRLRSAGGIGMSASKEKSLAEKYEYRERTEYTDNGFSYVFEPNTNLCEPEDGSFFIVMLPASCEYRGQSYRADIQLRLRGKDPDPFEGWDEEYRKLRERIEKFSLPEDKDKWMRKMEDMVLEPRSSTKQLRLLSKSIVRNYMQYWMTESISYRNDAEIYDAIVSDLEWIKFFGDCAFSYLVAAYAGPVAEALISPAKDFFTESIGEIIACWNYGEEVNVDKFPFAQSLESAGDNLMSNNIDLTNWRKSAATLSAYFVYASIKNYFAKLREDGESDLYGSLVKGFSDMTVQGLKAAAGKLFQKWIKNNTKVQKWIGDNITSYMNKNCGRGRFFNLKNQKITTGNLQYQLNDSLGLEGKLRELAGFQGEAKNIKILKIDIIEKYLTELIGKGAGWVKEKTDKFYDNNDLVDLRMTVSDQGHILITVVLLAYENDVYDVTVDLTKALSNSATGLFGMLYSQLFGQIPSFTDVIKAPSDPPLPPASRK